MDKWITIITIILIFLLCSLPSSAQANSGPVYWEGYPSADMMVIDQNSPITVENEELFFDFTTDDNFYNTVMGQVTATYEMANPTNTTQTVQMVFPFVSKLNHLSNLTEVVVDSKTIPYEVYAGDVIHSKDKKSYLKFEKIVRNITNIPYKAVQFEGNEKGKLYRMQVNPTTDEGINMAIDFEFDPKKTKVLTNGFNGYERSGQNTKISAWCNHPVVLEMFILGEDIDFNINGYTDGTLNLSSADFSHEITTSDRNVKDYLLTIIKNRNEPLLSETISDPQLYNLFSKALDDQFNNNMGYGAVNDLLDQVNQDRILSLFYTVQFPPNSKRTVTVTYKTFGTMDKTKTIEPLFTFDYLLNPAGNWSDFKNLSVKIISPKEAPFIIESSIKLQRDNNGYTAKLKQLPESDLNFTFYYKENLTLLDKVKGAVKGNLIVIISFSLAFATVFLLGLIIHFVKKRST